MSTIRKPLDSAEVERRCTIARGPESREDQARIAGMSLTGWETWLTATRKSGVDLPRRRALWNAKLPAAEVQRRLEVALLPGLKRRERAERLGIPEETYRDWAFMARKAGLLPPVTATPAVRIANPGKPPRPVAPRQQTVITKPNTTYARTPTKPRPAQDLRDLRTNAQLLDEAVAVMQQAGVPCSLEHLSGRVCTTMLRLGRLLDQEAASGRGRVAIQPGIDVFSAPTATPRDQARTPTAPVRSGAVRGVSGGAGLSS